MSDPRVAKRKLSTKSLRDWFIEPEQTGRRWTWWIKYPISRYAIVPTKDFATKAAAMRDAYRVIRVLIRRNRK